MQRLEYDRNKYTIWALPHPITLHLVLNPGMAFNELFLGQRTPKVILIDKISNKPVMERTFIPCPSCGELHDGRLWSKKNSFGHWFGYVCPSCGEIIPCLWNLTSLVILVITSPLWFIPVKLWKNKWIEYEKTRYKASMEQIQQYKDVSWVKMGFLYGGLMCFFFGVIPQIYNLIVLKSFNWQYTIYIALICAIAGFGFALTMKLWMGSKR